MSLFGKKVFYDIDVAKFFFIKLSIIYETRTIPD